MGTNVCVVCLCFLGLAGVAVPAGPTKDKKPKMSLEEAYRGWYKGFSSDKKEEREKTLRAMFIPTKKDIEYLFPMHAEKMWPLVEKSTPEVVGSLENIVKEITGKGPIKSIEAIDVVRIRSYRSNTSDLSK